MSKSTYLFDAADAIGSATEKDASADFSPTTAAKEMRHDITALRFTATATASTAAANSSGTSTNSNDSSNSSSSSSSGAHNYETTEFHGLRKRPEPIALPDDPKKRRICLPSISEVMAAHPAPSAPADNHTNRSTTAHFDTRL